MICVVDGFEIEKIINYCTISEIDNLRKLFYQLLKRFSTCHKAVYQSLTDTVQVSQGRIFLLKCTFVYYKALQKYLLTNKARDERYVLLLKEVLFTKSVRAKF